MINWIITFALLCFSHITLSEANPQNTVRLAIVNTPVYSGLIQSLISDFETQSSLHIEIISGSDVFELAKTEQADLVIAHFGKHEFDQFVLSGLGLWPKMVFSNQAAIIGPKEDPAKIEGLKSASDAIKQIAEKRAHFISNSQPGVEYLTEILWHRAGKPNKADWYIEADDMNTPEIIQRAESERAYFIWGAIPFLKFQSKHSSTLTLLVTEDPSLQRVMSASIINLDKVPTSNFSGAKQFQDYLLSPATQAKIAQFRSASSPLQLWWPAGRHN
jgi:tungstate transport system substrate-binding protein